ncbi:hypothetical protein VTN31DRAFT_4660 [Thermomyces dupontii]|uniref:uncharacterized protein n=1 Tax=Talaromyces thermophilus TaxID=28565 RepID=UPI003744325A
MRFSPLVIAALAGSAAAAPATRSLVAARHLPDVTKADEVIPSAAWEDNTAKGAAAFIGAAIGLKADLIDVDAKADLKVWLNGLTGLLDTSIIASIKAWADGKIETLPAKILGLLNLHLPKAAQKAAKAGLAVNLDGIVSIDAGVGVTLDVSLQTSLLDFLKAHADLDADVQLALSLIAHGGTPDLLTADIKAALSAFLADASVSLDADLKAALELWLKGEVGVGVNADIKVPELANVSATVGATVSAAVDTVEGVVSTVIIDQVTELLAEVGAELDVTVKAALELLAAGKSAVELDLAAVNALIEFVLDASSPLTAELRAVILLWLHLRAVALGALGALNAESIAALVAWLKGDVEALLGTALSAVLELAAAGESVVGVSLDVVAQVLALVTGAVDVSLDLTADVKAILVAWLVGAGPCTCLAS